jgi:hypothetical protein
MRFIFTFRTLACGLLGGMAACASLPPGSEEYQVSRPGAYGHRVVLTGDKGWATPQAPGWATHINACLLRKKPVYVLSRSDNDIVVEIRGSEALAGCQDATLHLHRVDERTWEGDGVTAVLVNKTAP